MRIYPMFYVEKLESTDPEIPVRTKESPRLLRYDEYEVERIEDYDSETRQYIVKWKRYPEEENTWELIEYLENCKEAIRRSGYPLEGEGTAIRRSGFRESLDRQRGQPRHLPRRGRRLPNRYR